MTYVVLKGYLYDPIDCIRPAVAIERGKYTEKTVLFYYIRIFYSIRLVLVSDLGAVSPFFSVHRDKM